MSQTKAMWVDYKINTKSVLPRAPGKARLIVLRENSLQRQHLNKALENVYFNKSSLEKGLTHGRNSFGTEAREQKRTRKLQMSLAKKDSRFEGK